MNVVSFHAKKETILHINCKRFLTSNVNDIAQGETLIERRQIFVAGFTDYDIISNMSFMILMKNFNNFDNGVLSLCLFNSKFGNPFVALK